MFLTRRSVFDGKILQFVQSGLDALISKQTMIVTFLDLIKSFAANMFFFLYPSRYLSME